MKKVLFLAFAVLALSSCTDDALFVHQYAHPSHKSWGRTDTLHFQLPRVKDNADYQFSVGMRLHNTFPYEGLWLVAETRLQHPDVVMRDTLYFRAVGEDGMPLGEGVSVQQSEQPLSPRPFELFKGQTGEVCIYHIMSREFIPAVLNVGLRIEKRE